MRVRGVNESHLVKRPVRVCVGKASGGLGRGEAPQVTSFGK